MRIVNWRRLTSLVVAVLSLVAVTPTALADNPPATLAATKSAPEVHVHIGRIDVKVPTAKAEKEIAPEKPRGVISLEEYLAQRRRN